MSTERKILYGLAGFLLLLVFIGSAMYLIPVYKVWQQGLEGQAVLAKAEQARRVLVTQAQAELEAAHARAEATRVVGQAAKEFPEYRLQEFVGAFAYALEHGNINQLVYVPTDGMIPVLEASRMQHK